MINLNIHNQPDDETCGPTCLQAVYQYYGLNVRLEAVIHSVERSVSGGTIAALLGKDALLKGFNATIYINDVDIFDPTWFTKGEANPDILTTKLQAQMDCKKNRQLNESSIAAVDFIRLGGRFRFQTINIGLLKKYFDKGRPIITGLSATYLYQSARECFTDEGVSYFDDIQGTPCGHFVILLGYDEHHRHIVVADPHRENPLSNNNYYKVSSQRLINAIMLGVLTYDATLLVIEPK